MKARMLCVGMMLVVAGCGFQHSPLWDKPPVLLKEPEDMTFGTRMRAAEVRLVLNARGYVVEATLEHASSKGGLPLNAEEQAKVADGYRQYRFRPAEIAGKPIASELTMQVNMDEYN